MASLFYKATFERRFPLTFLLLEDVGIRLREAGPDVGELEVAEIIKAALKKCHSIKNPSNDDISYVSKRLETMAKEHEDSEPDKEKKVTKQHFGSSYSKWAATLEPFAVCLLAAEYDYFLATRLYKEVDKDDVAELSNCLMAKEWEHIKVNYEAVVYGFGGGYSDSAVDGAVIDVSSDDSLQGNVINKAALDAVKF